MGKGKGTGGGAGGANSEATTEPITIYLSIILRWQQEAASILRITVGCPNNKDFDCAKCT